MWKDFGRLPLPGRLILICEKGRSFPNWLARIRTGVNLGQWDGGMTTTRRKNEVLIGKDINEIVFYDTPVAGKENYAGFIRSPEGGSPRIGGKMGFQGSLQFGLEGAASRYGNDPEEPGEEEEYHATMVPNPRKKALISKKKNAGPLPGGGFDP